MGALESFLKTIAVYDFDLPNGTMTLHPIEISLFCLELTEYVYVRSSERGIITSIKYYGTENKLSMK